MIIELSSSKQVLPTDIFGRLSSVCHQVMETDNPIMEYSPFFETLLIVLFLLFLHIVVRRHELFIPHLKKSFLFQAGPGLSEDYIQEPVPYARISMTVIGLFILMECVTVRHKFPIPDFFWGAGGDDIKKLLALFVAVLVFIFVYSFLVRVVFAFSSRSELLAPIHRIKMFHAANCFFILTPVLLLMFRSQGHLFDAEWYVAIGIMALVCLVYIFDILKLFRQNGISILYWFLYLCTLEILPVSLLLYPVLGGD